MDEYDNIIQFGPGRSGSTLITQALNSIFPHVTKTHLFCETDAPLVITYRHPCGIFSSICRVRSGKSNYSNDIYRLTPRSSFMNIVRSIRYTKRGSSVLRRYYTRYDFTPLFLRYERFELSFDYIFDSFEKRFEISIDKKARRRFKNENSRNENYTISQRFESFSSYERQSGIHGLHVSEEALDWEESIPSFLAFLLSNVFLKREIEFYEFLKQSEDT